MLLPEDPSTCHIMVATGTGIAPFRSYVRRFFCEDVPNYNFKGLAWLFMGVANSDAKLYDDEFQALLARYPDKVKEYSNEVFTRMDNGAHMYFCGLKGMMPGILDMLEGVCKEKGLNFEEWLESASRDDALAWWRAAAWAAWVADARALALLARRPEAQGAVARGDTYPQPSLVLCLLLRCVHDSDATLRAHVY